MPLNEPEELELLRLQKAKFLAAQAQTPSTPGPVSTQEDIGRGLASGALRAWPALLDLGAATFGAALEKPITGKPFGKAFSENMGAGVNAGLNKVFGEEYQPQTELGRMAKGGASGAALGIAGGPVAALRGFASGAIGQFGSDSLGTLGEKFGGPRGKMLGQVLGGVLGGSAGLKAPEGAKKAVTAVGNTWTPKIDAETAKLAQRAEDLGVPLSISQVAPSRGRDNLQKISQNTPLSGVGKFEAEQRNAWNRALAATLGEQADNLGPETIKSFLDRTSKAYDSVLSGKTIQVAPQDIKDLKAIVTKAKTNITGDRVAVVQANVDQIVNDLAAGKLTGEKFASLRSSILSDLPNVEGDARPFVSNIVDKLDDVAKRHLNAGEVDTLKALGRQWRNYKTVEPLLNKATDGNINPTQLLNRAAANKYIRAHRIETGDDDLIDLARIGKKFMPVKEGSDTAQKSAFINSLLGSGSGTGLLYGLANYPAATLGGLTIGAGTVGANKAYQSLYNQSPSILKAVIKKGATRP